MGNSKLFQTTDALQTTLLFSIWWQVPFSGKLSLGIIFVLHNITMLTLHKPRLIHWPGSWAKQTKDILWQFQPEVNRQPATECLSQAHVCMHTDWSNIMFLAGHRMGGRGLTGVDSWWDNKADRTLQNHPVESSGTYFRKCSCFTRATSSSFSFSCLRYSSSSAPSRRTRRLT